jgi:hypothetical protein
MLAASVCKGAQFHGDTVITSVAAAMVLIGRKGAEDAFFSVIKQNIDDMSAKGRGLGCLTAADLGLSQAISFSAAEPNS